MSEEEVNQRLEQQKKVYAGLMRICLRNSKCIGLSPWGLMIPTLGSRRTFARVTKRPCSSMRDFERSRLIGGFMKLWSHLR